MHIEGVRQSDGKTEDALGTDDNGNLCSAPLANTAQAAVTPAVTAGIYASGNVFGGVLSLANAFRKNGGSLVLTDLYVTDKGNQKAPLTILFFESAPGQAYTDHVACPAIVADLGKLIGQLLVAAADYTTTGGVAVAHKTGLAMNLANNDGPPTTKILYAVAVTTGTPTPASVSDVTFKFRFNRN